MTNPEDNQPFTEAAAWAFIAQMLEDEEGQEVELLTLTQDPVGKVAMVIKRMVPGGNLYVKIHYGNGPSILGRSFHYSKHEAKS